MQVLVPIMDDLDDTKDWSMLSQDAGMIAEHVLKPLFSLLRNSSASGKHGQIVPTSTVVGMSTGNDLVYEQRHLSQGVAQPGDHSQTRDAALLKD